MILTDRKLRYSSDKGHDLPLNSQLCNLFDTAMLDSYPWGGLAERLEVITDAGAKRENLRGSHRQTEATIGLS